MAMERGDTVNYTGDGGKRLALVLENHGEGVLTLQSFDPRTGAGSVDERIPKGEPGQGGTWHTVGG